MLSSSGQPGTPSPPRPALLEYTALRQVTAIGEFLDKQIGERRGESADGESWMFLTLDKDQVASSPSQGQSHQRTGESGTDDHHVGIDVLDREEGSCGVPKAQCG